MAEMNGSQCFPPPALCLRFPALQACTEDLPLVLQRPDNFPLVMGILQEINHEKVGSANGMDNTCLVSLGHRDQQIQTLVLSQVKLENLDVEDHHQHLFNSNPDLCQEWSLKGVEELLTDSEELQLRPDCYQQAHEVAEQSEVASAREDESLFGLQSAHSQFNQSSADDVDEAELLVDEKPAICSQPLNSLKNHEPHEERVLPLEEFCEAKPRLHALHAAVLAKDKPHQQLSQACAEDGLGLDNLQVVKKESEGYACCSEAQMEDLKAVYTSSSSKVVHWQEDTDCIISRQSKYETTNSMDTEVNEKRKTDKFKAMNNLLSGLPEEGGAPPKLKDELTMNADCELPKLTLLEPDLQLNLEALVTKRWTVHDILRSTSTILALPAEFTEEEKIQGPQKPPPTVKSSSVTEGRLSPPVSSEGADSLEVCNDFRGEDRKHLAVSPEADLEFCELTLSLGSSHMQTAMGRKHLARHAVPEEKPVVKNFFVQEEYNGQCQRTNPIQWQQATRCGSHQLSSTPAYDEKLLFSGVEGSELVKHCTDREGLTKVIRTSSKIFELCDSSPDEKLKKKSPVRQEQPSSPAGNHIAMKNSCLNGGVSRRTLRLMPQSSDAGGSDVEKGEAAEFAKPDRKRVKESSNVQPSQISLQSEQEYEFNEPQKKRMRGTLPIEEKGYGVRKEKDTRCHRSDGKSWRCARECINGAYYCQYHLRARRIGYNRRKNRDTDTDHRESVSKKPSKSGRKFRQPLSTSNDTSKL